jgi:hypothetical protein
MPVSVLRAGGLAGDLLKRAGVAEPPLTTFRVSNLITEMVYDTRSTEDIVGDLPFSMEDGVGATLEWLRGAGRDPRGAGT